jgi:hypothetical protein
VLLRGVFVLALYKRTLCCISESPDLNTILSPELVHTSAVSFELATNLSSGSLLEQL